MFVVIVLCLFLSTQAIPALNFSHKDRFDSCTPNSSRRVHGKLCYCDASGRWSEKNCVTANRGLACEPGRLVRHGCYECLCQNNGELTCNTNHCYDSTTHAHIHYSEGLTALGPSCKPFSMYFVNCSLCVCPGNGKTIGAHCLQQASCITERPSLANFVGTNEHNLCLPKVVYAFPCLQCECSAAGYFALNKCEESCHSVHVLTGNKCVPRTFFKMDCNVCWCPENGIYNRKYCSMSDCNSIHSQGALETLTREAQSCQPHTFSEPRCVYCDCTTAGEVNQSSCVQQSCIKTEDDTKYNSTKTCKPGEVVPYCVQCFCLKDGNINHKYCSNECKLSAKINTLQSILKESHYNKDLINMENIKRQGPESTCEANSIFIEDNKYCLCPENGDILYKVCVAVKDVIDTQLKQTNINWNISCEPNTFVKFDCNTCFCSNNSKIDPKWCTYDDCQSKRQILQTQLNPSNAVEKCTPGSILKIDCNFCICPSSGNVNDRACTKTNCSDADIAQEDVQIWCDPLTYYEVDCNVCYCPRNGIKNVDKCTKNMCVQYLRSADCNKGDLFSDNCNVCICPIDGNKMDKVCTNRTCDNSLDHWSSVFKLSQAVIHTAKLNKNKDGKILDLCFPGEQYLDGCRTCICPEMGLKSYATCSPSNCIENSSDIFRNQDEFNTTRRSNVCQANDVDAYCKALNKNATADRCTPGSMYTMRCKQCICPIDGASGEFCRPLPEQANCRNDNDSETPHARLNTGNTQTTRQDTTTYELTSTTAKQDTKTSRITHIPPSYKTTTSTSVSHSCKRPGWLSDRCFFCYCDEETRTIVQDNCFKGDFEECINAEPSFFTNKIISDLLY